MTERDGARILALAREIAFPRYPGTAGDPRARAIIVRRFGEAGLDVTEEPFSYDLAPALRALRATLVVAAVLVAAASLLGPRSPLAALALLAPALLAGGALVVWAPGSERLYAREGPTTTANVVGRRKVAVPRLTLILLAHHDSKSQNLTFPVRMGLTLLALGGTLALGAFLISRAFVTQGLAAPAVLAPLLGLIAGGALAGLSTLKSGNASPGGVDNAGSVGLVIDLAGRLHQALPHDVELIALCPGAEEDHMIGAMRWVDRHRDALAGRPVWALNFDGAGAPGRAVILERYGLGHRFSPALARRARVAARRLGLPLRGIWLPPAIGIDAIPFHHRGVACLTFSSGAVGRAVLAVHSAADRAEHLDAATLGRVARLAETVALDLAGSGH